MFGSALQEHVASYENPGERGKAGKGRTKEAQRKNSRSKETVLRD